MTQLTPDRILYGGNIYTVDQDFRVAEAVAIREDEIVCVGSTDEVRRLTGPSTAAIDLEGRTVVPGFIDCHVHGLYAGTNLQQVQLIDAKSIEEVLSRIRDRADQLPPGKWFRGSNHWSIDVLKEGRLPYRSELDGVTPGNPFWVNVAFHRASANSLALREAGIEDVFSESWDRGYVFRDQLTDSPNGHLLGMPRVAVMQAEPPATLQEIIDGVEQVQELFLANGITSVIDQGAGLGPSFGSGAQLTDLQIMQRLWREKKLKIRWRMNHLGFEMASMPIEQISSYVGSLRLASGFGDKWLRMGAIGELVLDGMIEDACGREPYSEEVFGDGWCGILYFSPETALAICKAAAMHGLEMNVHCAGNGALDLILDCFEAVDKETPIYGLRWTIEHGGNAPTEKNIRQCQQLGITVSTQQAFAYWHSKDMLQFMGDAAENYFPNRTWLDNGICVRAGSDFDCSPLSPLLGIWAMVTRRNVLDQIIGAEESISREDALRMYTRAAAYSMFEENMKGTIEPGKLADLVVLSHDLMAVPEEEIRDIKVIATIVGGEVSYDPTRLMH